MEQIYTPKFIGEWYNNEYWKQVTSLLIDAPKINANAIIVPHAGYKYSGRVLGNVYSRINFSGIKKIILLCTFHRNMEGMVLPSFNKVQYHTPKRELSISMDDVNYLKNQPEFYVDDRNYYDNEHSFEMQLPFLVKLLEENTTIIPILVGWSKSYDGVAKNILKIVDNQTMVIISTDFIHYGLNYNNLKPNIGSHKNDILRDDFKNFKMVIENNTNFIGKHVCGRNAILLWMYLNQNKQYKGKLVAYETSADDAIDDNNINSVSYAGFIFGKNILNTTSVDNNLKKIYTIKRFYLGLMKEFDAGQKINIMELLDNNITLVPRFTLILLSKLYNYIANVSVADMYDNIVNRLIINDDGKRYGIFITFEQFKQLGGCIGVFYDHNRMDTIRAIILYTLKTIFEDERFPHHLLKNLEYYPYLYTSDIYSFKINFLSKNFRIENDRFWEIYEPCKHGIVLELGGRSATFLPMVMLEQGWIKNCDKNKLSPEEKTNFEKNTFGHLIRKMGLDNSWRDWLKGKVYLYGGNEVMEKF